MRTGATQEMVRELFKGGGVGVPDERGRQGRVLGRTLSLGQTAELLDQLPISHCPGRSRRRRGRRTLGECREGF